LRAAENVWLNGPNGSIDAAPPNTRPSHEHPNSFPFDPVAIACATTPVVASSASLCGGQSVFRPALHLASWSPVLCSSFVRGYRRGCYMD
jgi:hypothetical protein